MTIKMERELREQFVALAAERDRSPAQVVRELMRLYVAQVHAPNALTAETIRKARRGEDVVHAGDAEEFYASLGI